jgi:hypothetical protein
MQSHLPRGDSRTIAFATTADGLRLPVIDVTHPAFAIPDNPASLAGRRDAFLAWDRRNRRIPSFVTRLLMRLAARRSPLLRKILASDKEYLDSISTYMLKIGADHLPPGFDGPMDRKVAADPHMALIRLRMQQIARLLAEALLTRLADASDAPPNDPPARARRSQCAGGDRYSVRRGADAAREPPHQDGATDGQALHHQDARGLRLLVPTVA